MDFTTIVGIVLVIAIAYVLAKAFSKKKVETTVAEVAAQAETVSAPVAEAKPAKKTAAKKPAVKKATTRKPKAK